MACDCPPVCWFCPSCDESSRKSTFALPAHWRPGVCPRCRGDVLEAPLPEGRELRQLGGLGTLHVVARFNLLTLQSLGLVVEAHASRPSGDA